MKKLMLLMLAVCLLLTACQKAPDAPKDTEPAAPTIAEAKATEPVSETIPVTEPVPETTVGKAAVSPLPGTIDLTQLDNCTVAVSLEAGDAYLDDTGTMQMKVIVYDYDLYDMVDISLLQVGDTIIIRGEEVLITELERDEEGGVAINGGLDLGGYELRTEENGVFFETGYSDVKSWYTIGEATIPVSPNFEYTDSSDPEGSVTVWYAGDFLLEDSGIEYQFTPYNTTITIEDGFVTAMSRVYTP